MRFKDMKQRLLFSLGKEVIKIISKFVYYVARQKRSYIRLHYESREPVALLNRKLIDRSLLIKILKDIEIFVG